MKNNGYFLTAWQFLWNRYIKNSVLYRVLCGVFSFFSRVWRDSLITNIFRRTFFSENTAASSLFGKILFCPFRLIEHIQKKHWESLASLKETSRIIRICKYFLHNLLAINLRFIGVMLMSAAASDLLLSFVFGGGKVLNLIAIALGIGLYFLDINAVDLLRGSALVKLIEKLLDIEFSFNFYYMTKCGGKARLICAAVFGVVTGIIAAKLSIIYAILFVLGLWFFFMILYKVEFGVFVTLFLAPIIPTMLVVGLTLLCLFSLIIKALTTRKFEFRTDGVGFMVVLLLVIYLIAAITSFAPFKSVTIWAVYFAFMAFYFVVINTVKTSKQLKGILTVFCLSGFAGCLYGILQYVFGWDVTQAWMDEEMFEDIKMRVYSTLENPNVLGEYILLVMPVCIALMWKKKSVLAKLVFGGMAAVMGVTLILTFSRGCWLGLMFAAAVFVTFAAGKLWGLALPLIPIVPMVLPDSIINRFTSIGDMGDSSTSYRVFIWMGTLLMLKDFWLSGIGPGTEAFTQVYPFYSYSSVVAPHSHNLFLQVLVESGVLGILTFLILIILFIKQLCVGHQAFGKGHHLSVILVGIGAGVLGFLVQGMFDNCFYNYRVFMIFWAVLALGSAAAKIAKNESALSEVQKNA